MRAEDWAEFFERERRLAAAIARKFGHDRVEDVLGAAWLAWGETLARHDPARASFRTHFARRLAVELGRERGRRSVPLSAWPLGADGAQIEFAVSDPEEIETWRRAALSPALEAELAALREEPRVVAARLRVGGRRAQQKLRAARKEMERELAGRGQLRLDLA